MLQVWQFLGLKWGERTVIRPPHFLEWKVFLDGYCCILCANGFAAEAVQETRMILSGIGLPPVFLGLKAGWIRGAAGERVAAEVLISQAAIENGERPLPGGLLLAGGAECGHSLLADPRVHLLVRHMLAAGRPVGLLRPVCYPLLDLLTKRSGGSPLLLQESQATADFVNTFAQRFSESGSIGGIAATAVA